MEGDVNPRVVVALDLSTGGKHVPPVMAPQLNQFVHDQGQRRAGRSRVPRTDREIRRLVRAGAQVRQGPDEARGQSVPRELESNRAAADMVGCSTVPPAAWAARSNPMPTISKNATRSAWQLSTGTVRDKDKLGMKPSGERARPSRRRDAVLGGGPGKLSGSGRIPRGRSGAGRCSSHAVAARQPTAPAASSPGPPRSRGCTSSPIHRSANQSRMGRHRANDSRRINRADGR